MMSKTHIAVGIAASLAVCVPTTTGEILSAVMGGAIGGILCDIECESRPKMRDALYGRFIAVGIVGIALLADIILKAGIWVSIMSQEQLSRIIGGVVLLITCVIGRFSEHRTFTHSLLYVLLITFGCFCIVPELLFPVLTGGISHPIIDTFNKMPVPWLFPLRKKGICFKICYASKVGNAICMWSGFVACIALLIWRIMEMMGKA